MSRWKIIIFNALFLLNEPHENVIRQADLWLATWVGQFSAGLHFKFSHLVDAGVLWVSIPS